MSEKKLYTTYIKETDGGKQVCVYCRKTEQEIGGSLGGHSSWCKWRRDIEEMQKAVGTRTSSGGMKNIVRRHDR
jgi:hypothetical protein